MNIILFVFKLLKKILVLIEMNAVLVSCVCNANTHELSLSLPHTHACTHKLIQFKGGLKSCVKDHMSNPIYI